MITETHECCGVKYGRKMEAITDNGHGEPCYAYFKLISANNKNTPNWIGVSEEEFHLSKKWFEREEVKAAEDRQG